MTIPVWKWPTRVCQAPGINPEEMDTSEIACVFFQDIQKLIHTLLSSIPESWRTLPKTKETESRD